MLICHCSDWHAELRKLPEADIYVVTGDMMPNFPIVKIFNPKTGGEGIWTDGPFPQGFGWGGREIDPAREARLQLEWMEKNPFRESVGIPERAPVVCVRGNHDFVNLGPWIGGNVWEFGESPGTWCEMNGVKFGGVRGINWIVGEWADELQDGEFMARADGLVGDCDVLVTHSPPHGILDLGRFFDHIGSTALANYVNRRMNEPKNTLKAHLFGHVHGPSYGKRNVGGTLFSNAAEGMHLVEL